MTSDCSKQVWPHFLVVSLLINSSVHSLSDNPFTNATQRHKRGSASNQLVVGKSAPEWWKSWWREYITDVTDPTVRPFVLSGSDVNNILSLRNEIQTHVDEEDSEEVVPSPQPQIRTTTRRPSRPGFEIITSFDDIETTSRPKPTIGFTTEEAEITTEPTSEFDDKPPARPRPRPVPSLTPTPRPRVPQTPRQPVVTRVPPTRRPVQITPQEPDIEEVQTERTAPPRVPTTPSFRPRPTQKPLEPQRRPSVPPVKEQPPVKGQPPRPRPPLTPTFRPRPTTSLPEIEEEITEEPTRPRPTSPPVKQPQPTFRPTRPTPRPRPTFAPEIQETERPIKETPPPVKGRTTTRRPIVTTIREQEQEEEEEVTETPRAPATRPPIKVPTTFRPRTTVTPPVKGRPTQPPTPRPRPPTFQPRPTFAPPVKGPPTSPTRRPPEEITEPTTRPRPVTVPPATRPVSTTVRPRTTAQPPVKGERPTPPPISRPPTFQPRPTIKPPVKDTPATIRPRPRPTTPEIEFVTKPTPRPPIKGQPTIRPVTRPTIPPTRPTIAPTRAPPAKGRPTITQPRPTPPTFRPRPTISPVPTRRPIQTLPPEQEIEEVSIPSVKPTVPPVKIPPPTFRPQPPPRPRPTIAPPVKAPTTRPTPRPRPTFAPEIQETEPPIKVRPTTAPPIKRPEQTPRPPTKGGKTPSQPRPVSRPVPPFQPRPVIKPPTRPSQPLPTRKPKVSQEFDNELMDVTEEPLKTTQLPFEEEVEEETERPIRPRPTSRPQPPSRVTLPSVTTEEPELEVTERPEVQTTQTTRTPPFGTRTTRPKPRPPLIGQPQLRPSIQPGKPFPSPPLRRPPSRVTIPSVGQELTTESSISTTTESDEDLQTIVSVTTLKPGKPRPVPDSPPPFRPRPVAPPVRPPKPISGRPQPTPVPSPLAPPRKPLIGVKTVQKPGAKSVVPYEPSLGPAVTLNRPDKPLADGSMPPCSLQGKNFCILTNDYPMRDVKNVVDKSFQRIRLMYEELHTVGDPELFVSHLGNSSASRGQFACETESSFMRPGWAQEALKGEWMLIVNTDIFPQKVRTESCRRANEPCDFVAPFYESTCQQRFSLHRLIAIDPNDPNKSPVVALFKFPAGCSCRVDPIRKEAMRKRKRQIQ